MTFSSSESLVFSKCVSELIAFKRTLSKKSFILLAIYKSFKVKVTHTYIQITRPFEFAVTVKWKEC